MKTQYQFTIQKYELNRLLQVTKHAITAKPIITLLECLKIEVHTTSRYITITASDFVSTIIANSNPDSILESQDYPWTMCVPAKTLINLVDLLPDDAITFKYASDTRQLSVLCEENTYTFGCDDPQDYPRIPQVSGNIAIKLESTYFRQALDATSYAIANDPQRTNANVLYIAASLNKLTFVSTDYRKLVKYVRTDFSISTDVSMLIPRISVGILEKIIPKNGHIDIITNLNHIRSPLGEWATTAATTLPNAPLSWPLPTKRCALSSILVANKSPNLPPNSLVSALFFNTTNPSVNYHFSNHEQIRLSKSYRQRYWQKQRASRDSSRGHF